MKSSEPPKEVQIPDFRKKPEDTGRRWERCPLCKEQVLIEVNGKEYYHRLRCNESNGIGYGQDRTEESVNGRIEQTKKTRK